MWLGRFQLGTYLMVYLRCTDANEVGTMPDYVPRIRITTAAGVSVLVSTMPVVDKSVNVGLFVREVFLGDTFAEGMYTVEMYYSTGSATRQVVETRTFHVIAGGDPKGQVLGMHTLKKPQAEFLVYQCESGIILAGKNARLP